MEKTGFITRTITDNTFEVIEDITFLRAYPSEQNNQRVIINGVPINTFFDLLPADGTVTNLELDIKFEPSLIPNISPIREAILQYRKLQKNKCE